MSREFSNVRTGPGVRFSGSLRKRLGLFIVDLSGLPRKTICGQWLRNLWEASDPRKDIKGDKMLDEELLWSDDLKRREALIAGKE